MKFNDFVKISREDNELDIEKIKSELRSIVSCKKASEIDYGAFEKTYDEYYKPYSVMHYIYTNYHITTSDDLFFEFRRQFRNAEYRTDDCEVCNKLVRIIKHNAKTRSCNSTEMVMDENIIPFANGDLFLHEKHFVTNRREMIPYRLKVEFHPDRDYTMSALYEWLDDLFDPADIPIIQKFIGNLLRLAIHEPKNLIITGNDSDEVSILENILNRIMGCHSLASPWFPRTLTNYKPSRELKNALVLFVDHLPLKSHQINKFLHKIGTTDWLTRTKFEPPLKKRPYVTTILSYSKTPEYIDTVSNSFTSNLIRIKTKSTKARTYNLNLHDRIREEAEGIAHWATLSLYNPN